MPVLIALVPAPSDPSIAQLAYSAMLGEGWTVCAYRDQTEVPGEVASGAEYVAAPPPQTVDARLLARAPALKLIQVVGHGFDHVNLADARAAGIPVASIGSSGAEAHTVAEMAILLAGAASRRIPQADRFMREGGWGNVVMVQRGIFELAGKTIGLVGLGRIGREVAKRARAFDMRVLYTDVARPAPEEEREMGIEHRDLDALLAESDVVSLHVPLTRETRGVIGERALSLMKPTAVLVNTARGQLVDTDALARALKDGRIRAAAIDVFDPEPPPADLPLRDLENVILSPHMAGVTGESLLRIIQAGLENCKRVARGEPPLDVVVEAEGE